MFDFLRCAACRACRFFFSLQHRSGCARQTGENLSRRTVHREVQNENEEPKSAPRQQKENTTLPTSMLEFHSTVVYSNSVDPFRSLLAPQAWALYHKSNTTSIVPVPALMRDWPALNSAVLALFAIVPGARFSAGERSVHVPALKGSLDCTAEFFSTPIWKTKMLHLQKHSNPFLTSANTPMTIKPQTLFSIFHRSFGIQLRQP